MYEYAQEMKGRYLDSLNLEKGSAAAAFDALVERGFRCGVDSDEYGEVIECETSAQSSSDKCNVFLVTIFLSGDLHRTRGKLLIALSGEKVEHFSVFCPYPVQLRSDLEAARPTAEADLAKYVSSLGSGEELPLGKQLLSDGFKCGFDSQPSVGEPQRLRCVRFPSVTPQCVEEEITAESGAVGSGQLSLESILQFRAPSVKSRCRSPFDEGTRL